VYVAVTDISVNSVALEPTATLSPLYTADMETTDFVPITINVVDTFLYVTVIIFSPSAIFPDTV
jgi:hypothetical protein